MHGAPALREGATNDTKFRLRRDVYDRLMENAGARTQLQQVELTGVPRRSLYRILNGLTEPSLANAMRIANALDVAFDVLFERVEA